MRSLATSSSLLVEFLLRAAKERGHALEPLLPEVGIDLEQTRRLGRVSWDAVLQLWFLVDARVKDPQLGLKLAQQLKAGTFDVLSYAIRTSRTLGEGLARVSRYHRLQSDAVRLDTTVLSRHRVRLCMRTLLPMRRFSALRGQFNVGGLLVLMRQSTGVELVPRVASFRHAAPAQTDLYAAFFQCPLRFSQPFDGIEIDEAVLALPMLKADADLQRVLERVVQEQLSRLPPMGSLVEQVRMALTATLVGGPPSAAAVAKALSMSPRTLQRKLHAEARTSLQVQLEAVREELAQAYLGSAKLPPSEVAYLLGFSEVSAFHRAFKRWTGKTPTQFAQSAA